MFGKLLCRYNAGGGITRHSAILKVGSQNWFIMKILKSKYAFPFTLLLSVVCFWLACSKNEKKEECLTCKSNPPEIFTSLKIGGQPFPVGIYKATRYNNLVLAKVQNTNDETNTWMQNMIDAWDSDHVLAKLRADGYMPVNYNLFMQTNAKTTREITANDVKAFGVILYKDMGLHNYLFTKSGTGTGFTVNSHYSKTTDDLNLNDKYFLFNRVVNNGTDVFTLVTMVTSSFNDVAGKVRSVNKLRQKPIPGNQSSNRTIVIAPYDDFGEKCDPSVCTPIQDQSGKCVERIGDWACKEEEDNGICAKRAVADANNRQSEFSVFDDAFYTLKYYVLTESTNGRSIIDKYNQAGPIIRNNLSRINIVKAYSFITMMHQKVSVMLNDTESKAILFDDATKQEALAFIEELRGIDGTKQWEENLSWLRSLVITYANKPTKEVFGYLSK
jgi:hypothetical protein